MRKAQLALRIALPRCSRENIVTAPFLHSKHCQRQIDAEKVHTFVRTLRNSDSGLYVSTGGFTKDARLEAQRATRPVHLLDLDQLVRAIVERYDSADDETRRLLPLVKIYLPA